MIIMTCCNIQLLWRKSEAKSIQKYFSFSSQFLSYVPKDKYLFQRYHFLFRLIQWYNDGIEISCNVGAASLMFRSTEIYRNEITVRGGQKNFIFELEPADSQNLIHYVQKPIDQNYSPVALKPSSRQLCPRSLQPSRYVGCVGRAGVSWGLEVGKNPSR